MPIQKTFEQLCDDAKTRIEEVSCDDLAHKLKEDHSDWVGSPGTELEFAL